MGPNLPFLQTLINLQIPRILGISVVVTPENMVGRVKLSHIPVWIATLKRMAANMQQLFVTRWKGVVIVAVL